MEIPDHLHINKEEGYSHVIDAGMLFLKHEWERARARACMEVFVELVLSEHQACEASIFVYWAILLALA